MARRGSAGYGRQGVSGQGAECERSGHVLTEWNAPLIGLNKLLCTNCGRTLEVTAEARA